MKQASPVPPGAVLTIATVSFASGVFASGSAVYLLTIAGLSALEIGAGASAAGLAAVTVQLPAGYLADRFPRRPLWAAALAIAAASFSAYSLVSGIVTYILVVVPATAAVTIAAVAKSRWVGDWFRGADRVRASALLRTLQNGGFALGAATVAVLFAVSGDSAASVLPVVCAILLAAASLIVVVTVRDARVDGGRRSPAVKWGSAFRDKPFLSLSIVNAFPMMNDTLLTVALPLWAVAMLGVPGWFVPATLIVNTGLVVALQIVIGRSVRGLRSGARAQMTAGILIGTGCVIAAIAPSADNVVTIAVILLVAAVVLTGGELVEAAAAWGICYSLAPEARRGEYVAVYGFGAEVMQFIAPFAVVALIGATGSAGWIVIGFLVAGACTLAVPFAKWARDSAEKKGSTSEELLT